MIRYDSDDPYLVVAADKGTATFSDIANAISTGAGFWLGDAFASGGSAGYDHKKMGITARGAWVSVERHFREMGKDVQSDDFSCVGIGDMSGDVFGNGMLLSKHTRLVAAFDHRHVFIDPDPDPAASWNERARMFALPRSSWADYDTSLISDGGGIFPRSAKSIPITEPMRSVLGIGKGIEALSPVELISACLKAPVDLLWNAGIGTYVKATAESNAQVGDKANDVLRVDGCELSGPLRRRGRQPRADPTRPDRVRRHRRPDQYRLHRQLRRSGHLRLRGEHQDPAGRRSCFRQNHDGAARRDTCLDDRRGRRPRAGSTTMRRIWRWRTPCTSPRRWPMCTVTGWSG